MQNRFAIICIHRNLYAVFRVGNPTTAGTDFTSKFGCIAISTLSYGLCSTVQSPKLSWTIPTKIHYCLLLLYFNYTKKYLITQ